MSNPFDVIDARLSNIERLLLDLKHNPIHYNSQPEQEKPLTIPEAAEYLGVSVATIYTLNSKGELPSKKRSKRVYFFASDLNNYLKAGGKKMVVREDSEKPVENLAQKKVLTQKSKKR